MTETKKLGRGIANLLAMDSDINFSEELNLGNNDKSDYSSNDNDITNKVLVLKITDIIPNPNQPRKIFNNEKIRELSESIKNTGLIQPIIVSPGNTKSNGKYIIIAGERRYRAVKMAGLETIKAIVLNMDEKEILRNAIVENIQRENLNPIEEANGYKHMIEIFGYTHEQLAKEVGKSRAHITNIIRILKLSNEVQSAIRNENITLGHAKVLLSVDEEEKQNELLNKILEKQLSVRQLEKLIEYGDKYDEIINEENNSNVKENHPDISSITFDMIKQLYKPLTKENIDNAEEDDTEEILDVNGNFDGKLNTIDSKTKKLDKISKIKTKLSQPTDEEWQIVEKNIKIIEEQLKQSSGFSLKLSIQQNGSGKLEIDYKDANELLEIVKFFS